MLLPPAPLGAWETRTTVPVRRSATNASVWPSSSPATRLVASEPKPTKRPLRERLGRNE